MTVPVYRAGGASAGNSQHIDNAAVGVEYGKVFIMFLDSRGFGNSHYTLHIESESFRDLMEAMLRANAEEAIKAIANVLKDGMPAPVLPSRKLLIAGRTEPSQAA